jgi:hypothetical protein
MFVLVAVNGSRDGSISVLADVDDGLMEGWKDGWMD